MQPRELRFMLMFVLATIASAGWANGTLAFPTGKEGDDRKDEVTEEKVVINVPGMS